VGGVGAGDGPATADVPPVDSAVAAFGVHDEIATHYGQREGQYEPHATTLDYVVAAAAG
jgi:hypothetical protein